MTLVFAEEFSVDGPVDVRIWGAEHGFVRNKELQWYQPANASASAGVMRIHGRREIVANPQYEAGHSDWKRSRPNAEYTSACLITKDTFSWYCGVLEIRARIDARPGLWPAIWTMGVQRKWPARGEVDIMEWFSGKLYANAHWGLDFAANKLSDVWSQPTAKMAPDWTIAWHTWTMAWTPEQIDLGVDGRVLNTFDLTKLANQDGFKPMNQEHYLLLNLAIGGNSGGDPANTQFPAYFDIDFVRLWQTPGIGSWTATGASTVTHSPGGRPWVR